MPNDPELIAMRRIVKLLQPLGAAGARRVLSYAQDRLQPSASTWAETIGQVRYDAPLAPVFTNGGGIAGSVK